ncbi:MAG: glucose-1-phosphate adenylyltransferase [Nitrospirota bacterium]
MNNILTMLLAGGKGERLYPLTLNRAKPAVPFGGQYRIIDFTLSNCINSNLKKIAVLTQYKSLSLDRHIHRGWNIVNAEMGEFLFTLPPQQRIGLDWYRGTADAIYQNMYVIEHENPEYLLVLSGDHIYRMNYYEMYKYHIDKKANATIGVIEMEREKGRDFGIIEVDKDFRVTGFQEKPEDPKPAHTNPDISFMSMGVYLFNTRVLTKYLEKDFPRDTSHDFGRNIIPDMIEDCAIYAYNFKDENKKEAKYWRDIGTIDAYFEANLDLVSVNPLFNLYEKGWPVRTYQGQYPPAKFVFAQEFDGGRLGIALDSIVCGGCIISGGRVQRSVLSPNVRINSYADIRESILMENVEIGRYSRIKNTIIDKDTEIPPDTEIGYDQKKDRDRFYVTPSGVVVVTRDMLHNY